MSDLIERLRALKTLDVHWERLATEAADEIERLQERYDYAINQYDDAVKKNGEQWAEIKRLRAELRLRKDEYVERQEWAAGQAMAVIKEALATIKEKDAEIERLRELTENDGKEIGSYRQGTGLRGENRRYRAALERIENLPPGHICDARDIAREASRDE